MNYYTAMKEDEFLGYVELHSETPRALFSKSQVAQMLELAGYPVGAEGVMADMQEWYSLDMSDLVMIARNKKQMKVVHSA